MLSLLALVACNPPTTDKRLGLEGASCTHDTDCESDLQCRDAVCHSKSDAAQSESGSSTDNDSISTGSVTSSGVESQTGTTEASSATGNSDDDAKDSGDGDGDGDGWTGDESDWGDGESDWGESDWGDGGSEETGEGDLDGGDDEDTDEDTDDDSKDSGCEEIECDPGINDCQGEQKCTPWRCGEGCCTNSTRCTKITGFAKFGDACTRDEDDQLDDCGPGLFCMPDTGSTGQGGPGRCIQLCSPEKGGHGSCEDLGLPGQHCFNFNQGSFPVCLETCDPIARDCAGELEECYLGIDNFFCTIPAGPHGDSGDPGGPGDECSVEYGCESGTICAPAKMDTRCTNVDCGQTESCGCCMAVCDLERDDPDAQCEGDEVCEPAVPGGAANTKHVGICVVPDLSRRGHE